MPLSVAKEKQELRKAMNHLRKAYACIQKAERYSYDNGSPPYNNLLKLVDTTYQQTDIIYSWITNK